MTLDKKNGWRLAVVWGAAFVIGSITHKACEPSLGWWPALLVSMAVAAAVTVLIVWVLGRMVKPTRS